VAPGSQTRANGYAAPLVCPPQGPIAPMQRPTHSILVLAIAAILPAQDHRSTALPTSRTSESPTADLLRLRFATFDPRQGEPALPAALRSGAHERLWIVQFEGTPTQAGRDAIRELGGEVHGYLPDNAYVVRMTAAARHDVANAPGVRWVGAYHPAYRIDPSLQAALAAGRVPPLADYHLVVVDKRRDKPALAQEVLALGGRVANEQPGSLLFTVTLTPAQVARVAALEQVLWLDAVTATGTDMDNARIQGGGNYVEAQGGFTGTGVNAHIYEGIEAVHPDFTGGATNVLSGGGPDTHGHATAGIVFGNGSSNPAVRGMAPNAGKFFTQYSSVTTSRWQVVSDLVNVHAVSHTTASWGDATTTAYTSVSADADDIVFDHDITWTQSQSNTGNRNSRPQAWAKNVFSVGGVQHFDDSNAANDSWDAGGASIGPAADGRIKPDLCAYYDAIGTSDLSGAAGYSANNWSAGFGGTSGATPIVAGHNVLVIQMYTDDSATPGFGRFGNALRVPGGTRHQNRPHFTTVKALQAASASQYAFTAGSIDNRREHQGWGFPSLRKMWDNRAKTYIVDETDVLVQGQASRHDVTVAAGETELKIVLDYADPAGNPAAAQTLINDLSLRVTSPSGVVYWGNAGLQQGNWSTTGGAEDAVNPIECVFVQNPAAGVWRVDVKATRIAVDSHVETPAVDADYALVVSGGTGQPGIPPVFATFATFGQGCPGSRPLPPAPCAQLNGSGGTATNNLRTWEYCYTVPSIGAAQVLSFDLYTRSNGGNVTVPAYLYAQSGSAPATTPLAATTITVGPTNGFYTATFAAPVAVTGTFYLSVDSSAQTVYLSHLSAGSTGTSFYRAPVSGTWTQSGLVTRPSWRVTCTGGAQFATPALGNQGLPILGGSYDVTLRDTIASTLAILMTGLSETSYNGTPLPYALAGAPGCSILVAPDASLSVVTDALGRASSSLAVPSSTAFTGVLLRHQWAVLDAANTLGIVVSNAGRGSVGD
jgi:serine protease AprX